MDNIEIMNITEIIARANKGDKAAQARVDEITGAPAGTYAQIVESFDATLVAAEMGSVECMEIVGQSYYTGMGGVEADPEKAIYWLEKASAESASAMWFLGQIHASHHEDYAKAETLMKKAIEMGLDSVSHEEIELTFKTNALFAKIKELGV